MDSFFRNCLFYFIILLIDFHSAQSSNILDGYYANGTILFSKNSYKHSKFSNPLQWNVKVSENQTLVIHFIKFDVGDWLCPGCRGCNYMEIYDENEKIGTKYCNGKTPPNFETYSNKLKILFHFKRNFTKSFPDNFELKWKATYNCSRKTHLRCDKSSCIPKSKQCDKIQDCEDNLDELKCSHLNTAGCGSNLYPLRYLWNHRIIGGQDAAPGSWPWMAMLSRIIGNKTDSFCGGTIISKRHIITAAHCFDSIKINHVLVHVGVHNRTNIKTKPLSISKVVINPSYDSKYLYNDIALIKLKEEIIFDNYTRPICLDNAPHSKKKSLFAIGWGTMSKGSDERPEILQQIELSEMKIRRCKLSYKSKGYKIQRSQICARSSGGDTCQGDSGGPLMKLVNNEKWVIVGISSFGIGCADKKYPGVYTRVFPFYQWIKSESNPQDNGIISKGKTNFTKIKEKKISSSATMKKSIFVTIISFCFTVSFTTNLFC